MRLKTMITSLDFIRKQIADSISVKENLYDQVDIIMDISQRITNCFQSGNRLWLCGNGGSTADAQHIAAELAGKLYLDRNPLPAVALTTNTSLLTAISNDYGFVEVFARQVKGCVQQGDVLIGISTSGNSENVIKAVQEAKKIGAWTIGLSGNGGKLKEIADICLCILSSDTPRIQEAHITAGHIICSLVENMLFEGDKT